MTGAAFARALVAVASIVGGVGCGAWTAARPAAPSANLDAAREMDQQGVRAYRDGRYDDAARYFRAAEQLGGPSSELWNLARAAERLDDPEGAAEALTMYLRRADLTAADRAEAKRELDSLRARPSVLTVATTPGGATVVVDDKALPGTTPLSSTVGAGAHVVVVRRAGYRSEALPVEARLGRAIIVRLDLVRAPD